MQLFSGSLLHVYNRGNNKQQIFFNEDNYQFFMDKANKQIAAVADILAWCLMPNHFHFLLHANEHSCDPKKLGSLVSTELQNGFRILQSSYANSINKEFSRTGSVFQQNTKFKLLNSEKHGYAETCFHYIHQNPLKAGLVNKLEDWKFSSFHEYMSGNENGICNKNLALELFNIKPEHFYKISYSVIDKQLLEKIW